MQMKKLEESLGRVLFLREGRGSRFSAEGERFIAHARRMVAINDEITLSYRQPSITGTVRFGTPDDYADLFLPEVLAKFARSHPQVTVDVECVGSIHLYERVKRGEIDLALVTFHDNEEEGEVLRQEDLCWVTSMKHSTHLAATLPVAAADMGCDWRKLATQSLEAVNKPYRIAYSSPNRSAIDAAVLQGLAIACIAEISVKPGMRVLTEADGFPCLGKFSIGLIRKPGRHSQAMDALAQHVRECFGGEQKQIAAA